MDGFPASYGEASDMDLAMMLAKVLHADLRYTEVDSWDYWEAFGGDPSKVPIASDIWSRQNFN
jgi:hypothetical protein